MVTAFRAHLLVLFDGLPPNDLPARIALLPQPFRAYAFFAVLGRSLFDGRLLPCEPSHESALNVTRGDNELKEGTVKRAGKHLAHPQPFAGSRQVRENELR